MRDPSLILASRSPRRADLLRQAGFRFQVCAEPVDENDIAENPEDHVRILSRRKASAVSDRFNSDLIIGADTIVYHRGGILGKPRDENQAFSMLAALSGETHQVYTGLTLLKPGSDALTCVERTDVTFRPLAPWEIHRYVQTGGPMDKAGAYGIQEQAGLFVSGIHGCYFNVMGFPLSRFFEMLSQTLDEPLIRAALYVD